MKIVVATIQDAIAFSNFDYNSLLYKISENYSNVYDKTLDVNNIEVIYDKYINNGMVRILINHNGDKLLAAFIITYPDINLDSSKLNQNADNLSSYLISKFDSHLKEIQKKEEQKVTFVSKIKNLFL